MKTISRITILVIIALTVMLFGGGIALAGDFAGGSGTESDPYQITNPEQLSAVRNHLGDNNGHPYFILNNDINLSAYGEWNPIDSFSGTFSGNGKSISNLTMNYTYYFPKEEKYGLFRSVAGGGVIKQLGMKDVKIRIKNSASWVGSLAGENKGTITNCYATGSISGWQYTGGLVGYNGSQSTITNCCAAINVLEGYNAGGLAGLNDGTIINCYAAGTVTGTWGATGGLVGANYEIITHCHATGSVSGYTYNGGLVGVSEDGTITNCYARGTVKARRIWETSVGGLVGEIRRGTITNCYAIGEVFGNFMGDLAAKNSNGTITNCYYNKEINFLNDNSCGTPLYTRDMQTDNFANNLNTTNGAGSNSGIWRRTAGINNGYPIFADNNNFPLYTDINDCFKGY